MPIDKDAALEIADRHLNPTSDVGVDRAVISPADTEEFDIGWVFFWLPQSAIESGEAVGGNSPVLVLKRDGSVHELGTADYWENSIARLRAKFERDGFFGWS